MIARLKYNYTRKLISPNTWIINLLNRQIEVHLKPQPEQKIYGSVTHYKESETFVSPLAGEVVVAELLPDEEEEHKS